MPGENLILGIGIDSYSKPRYPKLFNAGLDVGRFSDVLIQRYGFKLAQPLLLNQEATQENIQQSLQDLQKCSKEDNVIIYYAGHAEQHDISRVGSLIPIDGQEKAIKHILFSTIYDIVKGIDAKHILLIADCCYSGAFITRTRSGITSDDHEMLDRKKSRWAFVSAGEEKARDGEPGKGSPFANKILQFFENNQPSSISAGELFEYVMSNTIAGYPTPQAAPIPSEHDEGGQMIFRLKPSPTIMMYRGSEKIKFYLPDTATHEYYIPRRLSFSQNQKPSISFFFKQETEKGYLKDIIIATKRLVIIGSAGSGKSIELIELAKYLAEPLQPYTPLYKRFNTYTDQNIEDYLPKEWRKINPAETVIMLDGIDEVQPSFFKTAIRKVMAFSDENPEIRLIVTCRSNFYELPYENFSGTLESFQVYVLNDLALNEIVNYADNYLKIDGQAFMRSINEAHFLDLITKPFFLNILIKHYVQYGNLQNGREKIMETALLDYFNNNKQHYKNSDVPTERSELLRYLEKIGFVMEVIGKNFLTNDELHSIFTNQQDYNNCKILPAFNYDEGNNRWMFEHNNIQEYLASRLLENEPFERLLKILTINIGEEIKINPSWVNTLSFFISMNHSVKSKMLLNWLIENDHEILIRFEPDRITDDQRIDIFTRIFNFYSDKQIWLISNKFSDNELVRFGYFSQSIDFLLNTIDDIQASRISKLNATRLFRYFSLKDFYGYYQSTKGSLLKLLDEDQLLPYDKYAIMGVLADLEITDKETIDSIVAKYRKSRNEYIRSGLYKILYSSEFLDDHIDVFIDGLNLGMITDGMNDRGPVKLIDEQIHLERGLISIKRTDALVKLFSEVSINSGRIFYHFADQKEMLGVIVGNAVSAYKKDKAIFAPTLNLFKSLARAYSTNLAATVLVFFEATNSKWEAFFEVWIDPTISTYDRSDLINLLFDQRILQKFLDDYMQDIFSTEDIKKLHDIVAMNTRLIPYYKEVLVRIEGAALQKENLVLERPVLKDWVTINHKNDQEDFNLLFDKNAFFIEVEKIFAVFKKPKIDWEDLSQFRRYGEDETNGRIPSPAIELVRQFTFQGRAVDIKSIENWMFEAGVFRIYQISRIYEYLSAHKEDYFDIKQNQLSFIEEWCYDDGRNLQLLWYFLHRFEFSIPENKLLNLTQYFEYNAELRPEMPGTIELLEKFISLPKIIVRVVENLQRESPNSLIWCSNAGYALRKNIRISYPLILKHLEIVPDAEYKYENLLELWFKKTENISAISDFIQNAKSNDMKWKAVSLLQSKSPENPFLNQYLKGIVADEENNLGSRFIAANHLMRLNDIEGFYFVANHILQNPDPNFDFQNNLRNISSISNTSAIPLLMRLLLLGKQKEFQSDHFNSLEMKVLEAIQHLGTVSDQNYQLMKNALNDFIENYKETIQSVSFLHFTIARMEEQLGRNKSQNPTIEYALQLLTVK